MFFNILIFINFVLISFGKTKFSMASCNFISRVTLILSCNFTEGNLQTKGLTLTLVKSETTDICGYVKVAFKLIGPHNLTFSKSPFKSWQFSGFSIQIFNCVTLPLCAKWGSSDIFMFEFQCNVYLNLTWGQAKLLVSMIYCGQCGVTPFGQG